MISVSKGFRRKLFFDERDYIAHATITLVNGRRLNLTNDRIWIGGFSIEDAISEDDSFTAVGSTVMGAATVTINNMDEAYSSYSFADAKVILEVGLTVENSEEKIRKGTYTVEDASYNGTTIVLSLLDYMEQFDRAYTGYGITYPATLATIVRNACSRCGVPLATYTFPNSDYVINTKPSGDSLTYRKILSWVATIAGCFAKCNPMGQLEVKWFDESALDALTDGYDGGTFSNYSAGANLDGGRFNPWDDSYDAGTFADTDEETYDGGLLTNYDVGDSLDGGNFRPWNTGEYSGYNAGTFAGMKPMHYISSLYSQDMSTDDVVITGVQVSVSDEDNNTYDYSSGSTGYTIKVSGNPMITENNAQEIADYLGSRIIGLRFRKANVTHANDPTIEAGDVAILWDKKDEQHPFLITRTVFAIGSSQTTVSGAETPAKNSAARYSAATQGYVEIRRVLNQEISIREQAVIDFTQQLAEKSGFYATSATSGGVKTYYMHDFPTRDMSTFIWAMTTNTWKASFDGGKTWVDGPSSVTQETIKNYLSALHMYDLTADVPALTFGTINLASGKFIVDSTGKLTADDPELKGRVVLNTDDLWTNLVSEENGQQVNTLVQGIQKRKVDYTDADGNVASLFFVNGLLCDTSWQTGGQGE